MNKHPYNIFPEMLGEDYNRLKSDINNNGYDLKYPIWLYEDKILDGWNRQRVCNELQVQPIYKDFVGSDIEAINFVMRTNKRRNLTSTQWACVAVEAEDLIDTIRESTEKERRLKQAETLRELNKFATPEEQEAMQQKIVANKTSNRNVTDSKIAEAFNTNRTYINEAARLKKDNPEKFEQLKNGSKTISETTKEEKKEVVQRKVDEYRQEIAEVNDFQIDIYKTDYKFQIIYADPPWSYWESGEKNQSLHYQTMSIDDIKRLPIHRITDENCILFLWITFPILKESLELIDEWGFKYSTCGFVWVKKTVNDKFHFGNGAWTRANSELCLIATKGSITRIDASISQVLDDTIGEHSEKPKRVRELITRLVGELPRIELFSRNTNKDGWFNWGNLI